MKYLVTGGAGFIGSHLVERLIAQGHEVVVLDDFSTGRAENLPSVGVEVVEGDVNSPVIAELVEKTDGVFHLAAEVSVQNSVERPYMTTLVNVMGAVAVFDAASFFRKKVVYASSSAVYGTVNQASALGEADATVPISPYGAAKLSCELFARALSESRGLRAVGLRFFNVYGPRQRADSPYSGVVAKFLDAAVSGKPFVVFGDGLQTRDFVYVKDVAKITARAMHRDTHYKVLNVCTGRQTNLLGLAGMISKMTETEPQFDFQPVREGDIRHSHGFYERMSRALNIDMNKLVYPEAGVSALVKYELDKLKFNG